MHDALLPSVHHVVLQQGMVVGDRLFLPLVLRHVKSVDLNVQLIPQYLSRDTSSVTVPQLNVIEIVGYFLCPLLLVV